MLTTNKSAKEKIHCLSAGGDKHCQLNFERDYGQQVHAMRLQDSHCTSYFFELSQLCDSQLAKSGA